LPKVVVLTVGLVNSNFEEERSCRTDFEHELILKDTAEQDYSNTKKLSKGKVG